MKEILILVFGVWDDHLRWVDKTVLLFPLPVDPVEQKHFLNIFINPFGCIDRSDEWITLEPTI